MTTETIQRILTPATELYALSQGFKLEGDAECHWCGNPCPKQFPHDDPPVMAFQRRQNSNIVKRPGSAYICKGCWLWRRTRITIEFLTPPIKPSNPFSNAPLTGREIGWKDGQCPMNWSWIITERGAWAIRTKEDAASLYELILDPPMKFVLSIVTKQWEKGEKRLREEMNHLQVAPMNDFDEIIGDTPFSFAVDGVGYTASLFEIEFGLDLGQPDNGMMPGTRKILEIFGCYELEEAKRPTKRKRGREGERSSAVVPEVPSLTVKKSKLSGHK